MLSCKDTVRSASDYVDGRLSWRQRMALRLHLLLCDYCRRFLRQFRLASATACHDAQKPASDAEVVAVLSQIDKEPK